LHADAQIVAVGASDDKKEIERIQKTNATAAEKLKAFPTTKALDESKVGFLSLLVCRPPATKT
jgi:hypothetical protein